MSDTETDGVDTLDKTNSVRVKPTCSTISYEHLEEVLAAPPEKRSETSLNPFISWIKSKCEVLSKCDSAVVMDILQHCTVHTYLENALLIKSGDKGDCFFILLNGTVSVWVHGQDDPSTFRMEDGTVLVKDRDQFGKLVAALGPGQSFGEVALINPDCTRTASIICETSVKVLIINRDLYDRSIKQRQAKELHEKYAFIYNSAFFAMLPAKQRYLVACALKKQVFNFGNVLVKQGDPANDIYFILSGQVRVTCNLVRLQQYLDAFLKARELQKLKRIGTQSTQVSKPMRPVKSARGQRASSAHLGLQHDICLLSGYDVVGSIECALDSPHYNNTVTAEEEVVCFRLTKKSFISLMRDKSNRTTAALYKLAIMQNEGRITRFPHENEQFTTLLRILEEEYVRVTRNDKTLMNTIEEHIKDKTSRINHGFAQGNPSIDATPVTGCQKPIQPTATGVHKPEDLINVDGRKFLSTVATKGSISPSLLAVLRQSASRYAVAGHSVVSHYRKSSNYVKALSSDTANKRDRCTAWMFDEPNVDS